MKSVNCKFRQA